MVLNKSDELFPIRKKYIYLNHCGVSPLFMSAYRKEVEIAEGHLSDGVIFLGDRYPAILERLRNAAGKLMNTSPQNIAFVRNTTEGISLVANGYPLAKCDEIITYEYEYPATYYPWKLQEKRGARLILVPGQSVAARGGGSIPGPWTMRDLEERTTSKTRIITMSHVQFTNGYAGDLREIGAFCKEHRIDLVIDAAQSLGSLPVYPENDNVAAIVASGWKWLMGPLGTGIMCTSEEFREKIEPVMVGAEVMRQGMNYLDHSWDPHRSAKRFEYSTSPISLAAALEVCITDLVLSSGVDNIRAEIVRLQDIFMRQLDQDRYQPMLYPDVHRSGILSIVCPEPDMVVQRLLERGIVCSSRGGYLRIAPHFYNTEEEMVRAAAALNAIG